jgi:hypothetical protein
MPENIFDVALHRGVGGGGAVGCEFALCSRSAAPAALRVTLERDGFKPGFG